MLVEVAAVKKVHQTTKSLKHFISEMMDCLVLNQDHKQTLKYLSYDRRQYFCRCHIIWNFRVKPDFKLLILLCLLINQHLCSLTAQSIWQQQDSFLA